MRQGDGETRTQNKRMLDGMLHIQPAFTQDLFGRIPQHFRQPMIDKCDCPLRIGQNQVFGHVCHDFFRQEAGIIDK
jgi:cAMP phosphodiesterase